MARISWFAGYVAGCLVSAAPLAAQGLGPSEAAARVDQLLKTEVLAGKEAQLSPRVPEATFLRRITLDLTGEPATPTGVTALVLDPAADKRARAVDRLLEQPQFGNNWARYWRDVILHRATDRRAEIVSPALVQYLAGELNQKEPSWANVATDFITATGEILTEGRTGIIAAQFGQPEETTSEMARIFLGIQIQCAQCHDHPTDRWKRKQFHELAAFFPRMSFTRQPGDLRSFRVVSYDVDRPGQRQLPGNFRRGSLEHYMPDLDDPSAKGTLSQPVFFVTGQKLKAGETDRERRATLAKWITARTNPWFAKALVNRLWSELVGEGFYEPIDDMGPDRECAAPQTLEFLADQFAAHQYDVKWLFRTILVTDAYQRESRPRRTPDETPFVAACPQRLRAEQLLNALSSALGVTLAEDGRGGGLGAQLNSPRRQFNQLFGYDPSDPRKEVKGSIPQALYLMNSPTLAAAINGQNSTTLLSELLRSYRDDEDLVLELYLRCLAREPKAAELATALAHVRASQDRTTAYEDLLWALINSTEFLHRK